MRFFIFLLLGVLFLALQTTVLPALPSWMGAPDLLFLLIVFLAIHLKAWPGALLVVLFGIGSEVVSGYFLGIYTVAYLLVFFIVKGLAGHFDLTALNHQPPLVVLSYLFANAFVYLASFMLADENAVPWAWGAILQRVLILTILVVPFSRLFLALMVWCDRRHRTYSLFSRKRGNYYKARA